MLVMRLFSYVIKTAFDIESHKGDITVLQLASLIVLSHACIVEILLDSFAPVLWLSMAT